MIFSKSTSTIWPTSSIFSKIYVSYFGEQVAFFTRLLSVLKVCIAHIFVNILLRLCMSRSAVWGPWMKPKLNLYCRTSHILDTLKCMDIFVDMQDKVVCKLHRKCPQKQYCCSEVCSVGIHCTTFAISGINLLWSYSLPNFLIYQYWSYLIDIELHIKSICILSIISFDLPLTA